MNKKFYSSGFLYHPGSQQILLQQNSTDVNLNWTLMGILSEGEETSAETFNHHLNSLLRLKLGTKLIQPIYDYFQTSVGKKHFISYAVVKDLVDYPKNQNITFAWFSTTEVSKLALSSQTKQDIMVGRRVIDSDNRKKAGQRTIG